MSDIVWVSPQGQISVCKSPFPSAGTAVSLFRANCSAETTVAEGGRNPVAGLWGHTYTRWELTIWADFQLCLYRLLMSTGCKSSHSSFLDVSRSNGGLSISGWIGQLSCFMGCHDDFLHQLVSGSLPSKGWRFNCWRALEAMGEV